MQARQERHCETDYYYGASPAETLDFFPARKPGAPLLVFIHGGWWRSLDKQDFSFIAPAFVDAGGAEQALTLLAAEKPNLLLTDLRMGGMALAVDSPGKPTLPAMRQILPTALGRLRLLFGL